MGKGLLCPRQLCCLLCGTCPGLLGPHPRVPPGPQPRRGWHLSTDTSLSLPAPPRPVALRLWGCPSPTVKPPKRRQGGRGAREAFLAAKAGKRAGSSCRQRGCHGDGLLPA